jgi:hypothetical protein
LADGAPFPGRSLVRLWDASGRRPGGPEYAISELDSPNPANPNRGRSPARLGPLTNLSDDRYSYIVCNGSEELFDDIEDPEQRRNLAHDQATAAVLERFRAAAKQISRPIAK